MNPLGPPEESNELFVKICGVTSEADALLAVGMGASAVGFVFAPSPRQMTPTAVGDIVKRLPHETVTVGVFRDESPKRVIDIANHIGLRAVQLHGVESIETTRAISSRVAWTIKAFPAGHPNIERFEEYGAQTLLIDGANPGSGELFDWRLAEGVVDPRRLIVSGGLRPDNVGAAIVHLAPWGVDVASGVEASPGIKDPVIVRDFVTAARLTDREARAARDGTSGTAVAELHPVRQMAPRLAARRLQPGDVRNGASGPTAATERPTGASPRAVGGRRDGIPGTAGVGRSVGGAGSAPEAPGGGEGRPFDWQER